MNGVNMKKGIIFDMDGTLTPPRLAMTTEFAEPFLKWQQKHQFAGSAGHPGCGNGSQHHERGGGPGNHD